MIQEPHSENDIPGYPQLPESKLEHSGKIASVGKNVLGNVQELPAKSLSASSDIKKLNQQSIELSDDTLQALHSKLPEIAKTLNEGRRHVQDRTLSVEKGQALHLSNGKSLHPVEIAALNFYTKDGFRLINGMYNFDKSIDTFMEKREIPVGHFKEVKEAGMVLAQILESAVHKLPPTQENILYRGDAIDEAQIQNYQQGKVITQNRFSSVSLSEGTAGSFATRNSAERGGIPTLYIIENPESAKDIDSFSKISGEKERLYLPNQSWEITRVVDEITYTTTEINDEEDIASAREKGELLEKVVIKNGKEKTKYYVEDRSEEPERALKIYMKEV